MVEHSIAGDAFTKVQGRLRDVYEVLLVILELLVSKLFVAPVLREKSDRVSGLEEGGAGLGDTDALMADSAVSGSGRTPRRRRRRGVRFATRVSPLATL